jgi:hypothetical protein
MGRLANIASSDPKSTPPVSFSCAEWAEATRSSIAWSWNILRRDRMKLRTLGKAVTRQKRWNQAAAIGGKKGSDPLDCPSPSADAWLYSQLSTRQFLRTRAIYKNHLAPSRIANLGRLIAHHRASSYFTAAVADTGDIGRSWLAKTLSNLFGRSTCVSRHQQQVLAHRRTASSRNRNLQRVFSPTG